MGGRAGADDLGANVLAGSRTRTGTPAMQVTQMGGETAGNPRLPAIIQGGMGVGVSNWRLAQAVSSLGQLGVVSGTALAQVLVRRLQDGDPGGHMRRGLDRFPFREMAGRIRQKYLIPGGKHASAPYRTLPLHEKNGPREREEL